jgi:hypothetical protein
MKRVLDLIGIIMLFVCGTALIYAANQNEKLSKQAREQSAEIARLKLENEVMQVDTANWIVEHSELKGD